MASVLDTDANRDLSGSLQSHRLEGTKDDSRGEHTHTLLSLGGSQSSMPSGWTTASVTTSAMLMVPRMATTTDLRFLHRPVKI